MSQDDASEEGFFRTRSGAKDDRLFHNPILGDERHPPAASRRRAATETGPLTEEEAALLYPDEDDG